MNNYLLLFGDIMPRFSALITIALLIQVWSYDDRSEHGYYTVTEVDANIQNAEYAHLSKLVYDDSFWFDEESATLDNFQSKSAEIQVLPAEELTALEDLYNSTDGKSWVWNSYQGKPWDFSVANPNPCADRWQGIMCSCNESYVNISSYYQYYGYYDDSVGDTTKCTVTKMFLSHHNLKGTLPSSIGNFHNLSHLHLHDNCISGPIPESLFSRHNKSDNPLRSVVLFGNYLNSTIPRTIRDSIQLVSLSIGSNFLTGTIPQEIVSLTNLQNLALQFNSLTGVIPSSISAMQKLRYLDLQVNLIQGTIPSVLAQLPLLGILLLDRNLFTGTIPSEIYSLTRLRDLTLSNNNLSPSTISPLLFQLTKLNVLLLSSLNLTGSIPSNFGVLSLLKNLRLNINQLTGSIPASFVTMTNLAFLRLDQNQLTGTIPSFVGGFIEMQELYMNINSLRGTIPATLAGLTKVQHLLLSINELTGSIPESLFNNKSSQYLSSVTVLDLSTNRLTQALPSAIFSLPHLNILAVSDNCIIIPDSITPHICNGKNLTSLFLNGLQAGRRCPGSILFFPEPIILAGHVFDIDTYYLKHTSNTSIPPCIFTLPLLSILYLSSNLLTGNLESVTTLPPNLTTLVLSHNYLSSTIPTVIQLRSNWNNLDLSFNKFGGTLSSEMSMQRGNLSLGVNRISGPVPTGIIDLQNISILQGNTFDCPLNLEETDLPIHDPYYRKYTCGSNNFEMALIVWFIFLFIFLVVLAYILWKATRKGSNLQSLSLNLAGLEEASPMGNKDVQHTQLSSPNVTAAESQFGINSFMVHRVSLFINESSSTADSSSQSNGRYSNQNGLRESEDSSAASAVSSGSSASSANRALAVPVLEQTLQTVRRSVGYLTMVFAPLLLLIYGVLKMYYGTHTEDYAFVVSAGHLSGMTPGIVLATCFIIVLFVSHQFINLRLDFVINSYSSIAALVTCSPATERDQVQAVSCYEQLLEVYRNPLAKSQHFRQQFAHYAKLFLLGVVNSVIVIAVNCAYIVAYFSVSVNRNTIVLISILLSIFKLTWTQYFVPWLISLVKVDNTSSDELTSDRPNGVNPSPIERLRLDRDIQNVSFLVLITILNTIIAPCISVVVISPQCLFYIFENPPEILTTFEMPTCENYAITLGKNASAPDYGDFTCFKTTISSRTVVVDTPFEYTYQCSFQLLGSYLSIFVFLFVLTAFVAPLLIFTLLIALKRCTSGSFAFNIIADMLPTMCLPVSHLRRRTLLGQLSNHIKSRRRPRDNSHQLQQDTVNPLDNYNLSKRASSVELVRGHQSLHDEIQDGSNSSSQLSPIEDSSLPEVTTIFNSRIYAVQLSQKISIIMTFGLVFPPLMILGFISIFIQTYYIQFMIRRFTMEVETRQQDLKLYAEYMTVLGGDFNRLVILLRRCAWYSFPTGYLFVGFFLFDTVGNNGRETVALEAPSIMAAVAIVLYIVWAILPATKLLDSLFGAVFKSKDIQGD